MEKILIVFFCTVMAFTVALPANEQFDKATANDISLNSVSSDKNANLVVITPSEDQKKKATATVEISGISTGVTGSEIPNSDDPNTPFKPQRAGTMFARFIDDIFQIPITVLQSVARLITNPFTTQKKATPEAAVSS